jgi:hypothetical protein
MSNLSWKGLAECVVNVWMSRWSYLAPFVLTTIVGGKGIKSASAWPAKSAIKPGLAGEQTYSYVYPGIFFPLVLVDIIILMEQKRQYLLVDGCIANAMGPSNAKIYFGRLFGLNDISRDLLPYVRLHRDTMFIVHSSRVPRPLDYMPPPNDEERPLPDSCWVLDCRFNSATGPVVPQGLSKPVKFIFVNVRAPIFFYRNDGGIGISILDAARRRTSCLHNETQFVQMGDSFNTTFDLIVKIFLFAWFILASWRIA